MLGSILSRPRDHGTPGGALSRAKKRAPRTIPGVNEATRLRFALAEEIGASYASNHNAQVVMVASSVGRGSADRYSDIEVDVYYAEPPTKAERIAAVQRCGGTVQRTSEPVRPQRRGSPRSLSAAPPRRPPPAPTGGTRQAER